MDKVAVAVDGSEVGWLALEKAQALGSTELHIVHVGPLSILDLAQPHLPMGGDDILPQQIQQRLESNGREILARAAQKVHKAGLKVETHLLVGHPGEGICHKADELAVDCLVIGSRGHNKLQRLLLGSVSDFVVRHSSRPVLVVKQP